MRIAKAISSLTESFEKLPGIGPKSAQRLTYYLLRVPQRELDDFSENLGRLKKDTVLCSVCKNIAESDPCVICSDNGRDHSVCLLRIHWTFWLLKEVESTKGFTMSYMAQLIHLKTLVLMKFLLKLCLRG